MNKSTSKALFAEAQNYIPGGVNSPVRAFKAVGGDPLFIKKAKGAYMYDADDNAFIDMINSWGPMILGHAHPVIESAVADAISSSLSFGAPTEKEVLIAKLICDMVPSVEKVRMVNSGTEATMSAVRLARGFTGKDKMIKFDGNYHGHGDSFLIAAGSGAITMGAPNSPGVTTGTAADTLTAKYNDIDSVKALFNASPNEIACVIIEPVAGNMGCVPAKKEFLVELKELCTQHGALLIFDEVMTGFRLSKAGAQGLYGIKPDLSTFGKVIGGGMPVGAYGGRKDVMDYVSPVGPVYQAGTLSGNPIAMSAGLAILTHLNENDSVYTGLEQTTSYISSTIADRLSQAGLQYGMNQIGSMYSLFFQSNEVNDFDDAKKSDTDKFGLFFNKMLEKGIYLAPSQYESLFVSTCITDELADKLITTTVETIKEIELK